MERLIRFFVERHLLVHILFIGVIVVGLIQASRLPRETMSQVSIPKLFVIATLPGAAARDVEKKITMPIQEVVQELNGVKAYNSIISDSLSRTEVDLYDKFRDARIREAENDLRILIDGISDFPPELEDDPRIQHLNTRLFPVVQVALAGPVDALAAAGKALERRLRRLDEVSTVSMVGLDDPEVRILVDPLRARENAVTLQEVTEAIGRRNVSATGGILESAADRRQVMVWSRFEDPLDVANTVIRFTPDGGAITIADVARIELGREDNGLIAHTNSQRGLSLVVNKQDDADIIDTVAAVRRTVEAMSFPPGVSAVFVRDESFLTRNRLRLMFNNGVMGAVLVILVLVVFLTPRAAFWTLAGVPMVFLATLTLFPLFDFSINIITLTGLVVVLGMVVDDAIVVSERIVSRQELGEEPHLAAIRGGAEMANPVFASALTTMLAFLPMWGLGGMSGMIVAAMPGVVILALMLSVTESFILLPAHLSMGRSKGARPKRRFMVALERHYRRALEISLRHRLALLIVFITGLAAIYGGIAPRMQIVLFPQDDSPSVYIKLTMPPGTPIEQTEAVAAAVEQQIVALMGPDLMALTARIGHQDPEAFDRTQGSAENEAIVIAEVRPLGRTHTSAEWTEILRERIVAPEGAELIFEAQFLGPPIGRPITVHVATDSDELRRATANEVAGWLRGVQGVSNVDIDERPGMPQLELDLDYERLALRGLDAQDVAQTVQAAFYGLKASEHRELGETTTFRVLLESSARGSLDALLELPVRNASGQLIHLRDVVTPIEVPAITRIYHRDGVRTATVTGGFTVDSEYTPLSMADRIERELFPRYADVKGIELSIGGEAEETRKTSGDLGLVALLAFGGIGIVIAVMLGSLLEAAFVIAVIPFAVAGVILAFFLHGEPLSMFAMMGAIGLSGVVVNSSIVMIDSIHRALRQNDSTNSQPPREVLIEAVVGRLRPIMVTTLTTLGGVLPMAYGIGGHDPLVAPISLALGWGLAFSTVVTLFLVPTLYTVAGDLQSFLGIGPGRAKA